MAKGPKQNPDRTLRAEGRLIWDGTWPNQYCPKEDHPPADQPRHEELIREILWWKQRFPGIPILLSKKDVREAFRWLLLHVLDAHTFGADLEGSEWGVDGDDVGPVLGPGRATLRVDDLGVAHQTLPRSARPA